MKELAVKYGVDVGVMGYLRPKQDYNLGKKQEHSDRVLFTESKAFEAIDKMASKDKL